MKVQREAVSNNVLSRDTYPFHLTLRDMDKLLLLLLDDMPLEQLYTRRLRDNLEAMLAGFDARRAEPLDCDIDSVLTGIRELAEACPPDLTLKELVELSRDDWPEAVRAKSTALREIGFFLPHNHIPESGKADVTKLFDKRKFVELLGDKSLITLYTTCKQDYRPRIQHIINKSRQAGVLARHRDMPFDPLQPVVMDDKNDMACDGDTCREQESKYCELDENGVCNSMSDPYDPGVG